MPQFPAQEYRFVANHLNDQVGDVYRRTSADPRPAVGTSVKGPSLLAVAGNGHRDRRRPPFPGRGQVTAARPRAAVGEKLRRHGPPAFFPQLLGRGGEAVGAALVGEAVRRVAKIGDFRMVQYLDERFGAAVIADHRPQYRQDLAVSGPGAADRASGSGLPGLEDGDVPDRVGDLLEYHVSSGQLARMTAGDVERHGTPGGGPGTGRQPGERCGRSR